MPTTSNFGWTTPADTDLVKDGALAIRTLGNGIDASFLDLKGGTTGQVLSKTSNTDLDFTWVAQDDSNAIQNAIVDAKGDLISATAADTPARLGVGTDGQVLTADSTTATGLKWAGLPSSGGETLITTTNANDTASSYDFTSLGSYKHLRFVITKLQTTGTDNRAIGFQFNNDTSGNYTNYSGRNSIGDTEFNSNNIALAYSTDSSARYGQFVVEIWNYGSSTEYKAIRWYSAVYTNGTAYSSYMLGHWNSTSAITSVKFFSGSNFKLGTFKVYGIS